jgi:hypothetical protein
MGNLAIRRPHGLGETSDRQKCPSTRSMSPNGHQIDWTDVHVYPLTSVDLKQLNEL